MLHDPGRGKPWKGSGRIEGLNRLLWVAMEREEGRTAMAQRAWVGSQTPAARRPKRAALRFGTPERVKPQVRAKAATCDDVFVAAKATLLGEWDALALAFPSGSRALALP
jgi:hypothetical protein